MTELTRLWSRKFYRSIWRILQHDFCDEYWYNSWCILRSNVENEPKSFVLYVPFVLTYTNGFFRDVQIGKKAEKLGLLEIIDEISTEFRKEMTIDEFEDMICKLGDISLKLIKNDDPDFSDYFEAVYDGEWKMYRDGDCFSIVDAPNVLDVNLMTGHIDDYTKVPLQILAEYKGREYEICLAEDWPETLHIKTRCPYLVDLSNEEIDSRYHFLFNEALNFYLFKCFRVSDEEKEYSKSLEHLPLIVGGVKRNRVVGGGTGEKTLEVKLMIVQDERLSYVLVTINLEMTEVIEFEVDGCISIGGWPYGETREKFKAYILEAIRKYKEQLSDGFVVERENMAEDNGCAKLYFQYL